jgi:hypothetical protein
MVMATIMITVTITVTTEPIVTRIPMAPMAARSDGG